MRLVPGPDANPSGDQEGQPGDAFAAVVNTWEQFAWNDLHAALATAPGAPDDAAVLTAMTDAVFGTAKVLWTEREKIATDAGIEASAVTAVVAQPHLGRKEAVALVLSMLHGGDPRHREHAEQLVDDAWQIGQSAPDPWAVPVPTPREHTAKILPWRPRG